jgi:type III pantothenate kinase
MILDLDVGNTRVKWRKSHADGSAVISHGAASRDNSNWINDLVVPNIVRVRISSVAGQEVKDQLLDSFTSLIDVTPEFACSAAEAKGVQNGYDDPTRLGVDRWLAVLAAFERSDSSCCVVDCGSAITVDYVSADGLHKGGLIAPGIALMRNALLKDTQEIELRSGQKATQDSLPAATSTESAVESGLRYMEAGLVEIASSRFESVLQETSTLILTGGDASLISELISRDHQIVPQLVLDGLAIALP